MNNTLQGGSMSTFICSNDYPVVETCKGKLRGFFYKDVFAFYGIPYAQAKRFEMPEEVPAWEGTKDALSFGYICPILSNPRPSAEVRVTHRFWPDSEDCQNLNVWTPTIEKGAKKPVIVWFHGGGFANGSAIEQVCYDGDNLARYGDAVVVTVNHRLNVFGYLDLSAYGEKYHNSANVGVADLVASLKWVHDNISAFGGDPDNVTIMGQSGGGMKVTCMGQIPAAAGLFHKAVILSGVSSPEMSEGRTGSAVLAEEIMKVLRIDTKDVDDLQKVPTVLLIRATNKALYNLSKQGIVISLEPKQNDYFLGDPAVVPFSDYFRTVPLWVNSCISEMGRAQFDKDKDAYTEEERRAFYVEKYGDEAKADKAIELFKKAYPGKNILYGIDIDVLTRRSSARYAAKKAAESTAPAYNGVLAFAFPIDGGKGAWHCSDLPFVFHNTEKLPLYDMGETSDCLQAQMSGALLNFARTGNPNNDAIPEWKPSTPDTVNTMVFDTVPYAADNFDKELLEYIDACGLVTNPFAAMGRMVKDPDEGSDGREWLY